MDLHVLLYSRYSYAVVGCNLWNASTGGRLQSFLHYGIKLIKLLLLIFHENSPLKWKALHKHIHSCQPLLGVNLSPEFVNLYFPYAGRVFCFFAGTSCILNSNRHVWQWKEEAMLCKICMHNFKSHFWWDFLAYCTRPARVNLVMAFIGCLFNSFSIFLLSLKQQQNLMKIMFSCIHFPVWPYPPKIITVFYTGKLYGLTGMGSERREKLFFQSFIFLLLTPTLWYSWIHITC